MTKDIIRIEIWKDIKEYENVYKISNLGNVKRLYKNGEEKILKNGINGRGYANVSLSKDGIYKSKRVHVLVAEAFLVKDNDNLTVNHIDGNKLNNDVTNLEWVTHKDNIKHAIQNNLTYLKKRELNRGELKK